jgi:hypothetical protein
MGLSDACHDFLVEVEAARSDDDRKTAVATLSGQLARYSESPFDYGDEIELLAYACEAFIAGRPIGDLDSLERLRLLAEMVRTDLDTPPPPTR